ncbi:MAG TPA: hypothetical protein VFY84_05470 [Jiangellales bacterium]|nr:hypothetical protein [Jiangellales bacterium]
MTRVVRSLLGRVGVLVLAVSGLSGCSPTADPGITVPASTSAQGPAEAVNPRLVAVGQTETVFDWTRDRCDAEDIPDLGARAYRGVDGQVTLVASHHEPRRFISASLDDVTRDCAVVVASELHGDPSRYTDRSWLAAPYTEDGQTVYALVHNEYHGHQHPGMCPQGAYEPCWYNAVTAYVSTDGGRTFAPAAPPPGHLVASAPQPFEAGAGPYGVFEPSNIIKHSDGMYYAFLRVVEARTQAQRICLIRTATLDDPASWRAWDGDDFGARFVDPYLDPAGASSARPCAGLDINRLGVMNSSITFNTYLQRYVMVGVTASSVGGREVWGVHYSFSSNLIDWQIRRLLFEVELPWSYAPGDDNVYLYPVLLDPASDSRNFETTGERSYLYLTRFNTREAGDRLDTLDRDLVRIPVRFFPSPDDVTGAVDFLA